MSGSENPTDKEVAKEAPVSPTVSDVEATGGLPPIDDKPFMEAIWPVLACGAGLFSDGYINNVIGSVSTVFTYQYGDVWSKSQPAKVVSAIAFAGAVRSPPPVPFRREFGTRRCSRGLRIN
ncbi:hypothetical protein F5X97DRAFT_197089 [Nemania serpens]|nr:hypothetical protein F5X97DRAFT_197089 [Nemania serpens]